MKHITNKMLQDIYEATHRAGGNMKLVNEPWMPLHCEITHYGDERQVDHANHSARFDHLSLTHYGEQNGDLMRDPEMIFICATSPLDSRVRFVPYYYRNDYVGRETIGIQGNTIWRSRQSDQAAFARQWLTNLRQQGFSKVIPRPELAGAG